MSDTLRVLGRDWLDLTIPEGGILSGVAFDIDVAAKDAHNDADTAYSTCNVQLFVTDENGDTLAFTVDGTATDTVMMTSGEATFSNVRVTVGAAAQVNFVVEMVETVAVAKGAGFEAQTYRPEGAATRFVGELTLAFTSTHTTVSRDSNFTITVQVQDGYGNKVASANGTAILTLFSDDASDLFDSHSAAFYEITIVNGEWTTTTEQITGGSGNDDVRMTATGKTGTPAASWVGATTPDFSIVPVITLSLSFSNPNPAWLGGNWWVGDRWSPMLPPAPFTFDVTVSADDPDYVPQTTLTLYCSVAGYTYTPITISNTGWSGGRKTVSGTITWNSTSISTSVTWTVVDDSVPTRQASRHQTSNGWEVPKRGWEGVVPH